MSSGPTTNLLATSVAGQSSSRSHKLELVIGSKSHHSFFRILIEPTIDRQDQAYEESLQPLNKLESRK
jgi:hypothetical protein